MFVLFLHFWTWKQKILVGLLQKCIGFVQDHARQHIVNGGTLIRYFGTFSDAANFGIHMACASVSFFIIALPKIKKGQIILWNC